MSADVPGSRLADTRLPSDELSVAERRAELRAQRPAAQTPAPHPTPVRTIIGSPAAPRPPAAPYLSATEEELRAQVRRLNSELEIAGRAVDEYATAKLAAEAETTRIRDELESARVAADIFREQIEESEDRATAAAGDAHIARRERDHAVELLRVAEVALAETAASLEQTLTLSREDRDARLAAEAAYRHERAEHAQTVQSFEELRALTRRSPEAIEVLAGSVPPRVGELVIEQNPNGTRVVYTSRKPASIRLGGVEIDIDGTTRRTAG